MGIKNIAATVLLFVASLALVVYLFISSAFPFKDNLFSFLYPKALSKAVGLTGSPEIPSPTSLRLKPVSPSQINLTWELSDKSAPPKFEIYRDGTRVATTSTNSYGDTGLTSSTNYSYYVRSLNPDGKSSLPSNISSATTLKINPRTGNITGSVYSNDGIIVPGARITFNINGSNKSYITNSKGGFSINELPAGTYSLTIIGEGFGDQNINVHVTGDTENYVRITLNKI